MTRERRRIFDHEARDLFAAALNIGRDDSRVSLYYAEKRMRARSANEQLARELACPSFAQALAAAAALAGHPNADRATERLAFQIGRDAARRGRA